MTVDLVLCDRFVAFLQSFAVGEAQAMTAKTLIAGLDLPETDQSRRHLRVCIQHAIRSGRLICASNSGYYVPATPAEVMASTRRLKSEAGELFRRAKRVEELAAEHFELRDEPEAEPVRPALPALLALMETV